MPTSMPSIPRAVGIAYRDLAGIARELTALMIVSIVVMSATELPVLLLTPEGQGTPSAYTLLAFVSGLVQTFLLTPFFIAIHRFIILGETTARYALSPRTPRFQLYFTLWAAFSALTVAPLFVLDAGPSYPGIALVLVWIVAVMIAGLRLAILFPAIAVDAPGATVARTLADTKGRAWRIFAIGLLALLPLMVINMLVRRIAGAPSGSIAMVIIGIADGVLGTLMMTLFLAIDSRLYQWLGDKVKS